MLLEPNRADLLTAIILKNRILRDAVFFRLSKRPECLVKVFLSKE